MELVDNMEIRVVRGIRLAREVAKDQGGGLRSIRVDIKITPTGGVRAIIINTETEMGSTGFTQ